MNSHNKIKWTWGMAIDPDLFTHHDEYYDSLFNTVQQVATAHSYGIIPHSVLEVCMDSSGRLLKIISLEALSQSGLYFVFRNESIELNNAGYSNNRCYLVASHKSPTVQKRDGIDILIPAYNYNFRSLEEISIDEFSIAKVSFENGRWGNSGKYIPPCMSFASHPGLQSTKDEVLTLVREIVQLLEWKYPQSDTLLLRLLEDDIMELGAFERPKDLYLLTKKAAVMLSRMPLDCINVPKVSSLPDFNNNDFVFCVNGIIDYLKLFKIAIEKNEYVKKEEENTEKDWIDI